MGFYDEADEERHERDALLLEKASFVDRLNAYLREEYPPSAPQAEISDDLKKHLDMLVARLRVKIQNMTERYESNCHVPSFVPYHSYYSCNGDPRGCERERFGGCAYHEAKEIIP